MRRAFWFAIAAVAVAGAAGFGLWRPAGGIAADAAYKLATDPTPERKLKEMRLAIGLEKETSKDDILLGYLNIALFGGTVYGIEAAANYYYGIPASQLSTSQAASLLAIVNNPSKFRFDDPTDEAPAVGSLTDDAPSS